MIDRDNDEECVPMFYSEIDVDNRRSLRLVTFEVTRNKLRLEQIEMAFLGYVLEYEDVSYPYELYYLKHLEVYEKHLNWLGRKKKCKVSAPNMQYFEMLYKPVEKEYEINITINQILRKL